MEVPGKRRRGRPKRRWLDNIRNDLSERELSGEEAQDRVQWRRLIRNIDATLKRERMRKKKKKKIASYCSHRDPPLLFEHGTDGKLKIKCN